MKCGETLSSGHRGVHSLTRSVIARAVMICALHINATSLAAQDSLLTPRGGEHENFTRLTLQLPARTGWALRQRDREAQLIFDPAPTGFDLSQAFLRLNRMRLLGISSSAAQLVLDLGCDCTVAAEVDSSGLLIIDIRGSADTYTHPAAARRPPPRPDRGRDQIARQVGQTVAQQHATLGQVPIESATALWEDRLLQQTARRMIEKNPGTTDAPPPRQLPHEVAGPLARQLARAAGRGIVSLRPASPDAPNAYLTDHTATPPSLVSSDPVAAHLRLGNRAAEDFSTQQIQGGRQSECYPDEWFDFGAWGASEPFHLAAAEFRQSLLDNEDQDRTADYARFYLHYGFGNEAAFLLSGASFDTPSTNVLRDLAQIVDEKIPISGGTLHTMTTCDGRAALWALMAASSEAVPRPNIKAVVRSFGELPDHLRRDLGPRLAQRLLDLNEVEAAQLIQSSTERSSNTTDQAQAISAARITMQTADTNDRDTRAALEQLSPSSDAIMLQLEHALANQRRPDPGLIESALAYASDLKDTPAGGRLYSLSIEGLARTGAYSDAFATLSRLNAAGVGFLAPNVEDIVWDELAASASDPDFVSTVFDRQPWLDPQKIRSATRNLLADRLADLGFFAHANTITAAAAMPREVGGIQRSLDSETSLANGSDIGVSGPNNAALPDGAPNATSPAPSPPAPASREVGDALLSESSALRENLIKLLGAQ